ncbi:hypothetical protein RCL1_007268 [Eukaryota sp. TZLM3-RCL]
MENSIIDCLIQETTNYLECLTTATFNNLLPSFVDILNRESGQASSLNDDSYDELVSNLVALLLDEAVCTEDFSLISKVVAQLVIKYPLFKQILSAFVKEGLDDVFKNQSRLSLEDREELLHQTTGLLSLLSDLVRVQALAPAAIMDVSSFIFQNSSHPIAVESLVTLWSSVMKWAPANVSLGAIKNIKNIPTRNMDDRVLIDDFLESAEVKKLVR